MSCNLLIIDDDIEILELLKIFLKMEDFNIMTSTSGIGALELIKKKCFNLVILDLGLPDIEGEQLCKLIRKNSTVPILILSAKESVTDKVLCFEYGADDYLTKPFEKIELLARIKAIMRRCDCNMGSNDEIKEYVIANLVVNVDERTLKKENLNIDLTSKEFDILLYFLKNKNKTIKRDDIIKEIWGNDSLYKWSRSLDVHIQHIRHKIEDNPKKPRFIKTISGIGYKFEG
jgi:two-component system alkaline phosphatase synthesis response regulator PhoP